MSVLLPLGPRRRPNVLSLVATLVVVVGALLWLRGNAADVRAAPSERACAEDAGLPGCEPTGTTGTTGTAGATPGAPLPTAPGAATAGAPVVEAAQACHDVGYLCAPLDTGTAMVVRRWKGFHGTMVVHVPAPDFEDPTTARLLQNAAADGILLWNGQPFPIVVDRRGTRKAQFEVRWSRTLSGSRLGVAHTVWSAAAGLRVASLDLTTRNPFDPSRTLDPRQVRLTAAHEMGHALGLPHSDQKRDVMYPTNTATALTARDYRTVEALYAIADGTRIVR